MRLAGYREYRISKQRAEAVRQRLISKYGIQKSHITAEELHFCPHGPAIKHQKDKTAAWKQWFCSKSPVIWPLTCKGLCQIINKCVPLVA